MPVRLQSERPASKNSGEDDRQQANQLYELCRKTFDKAFKNRASHGQQRQYRQGNVLHHVLTFQQRTEAGQQSICAI